MREEHTITESLMFGDTEMECEIEFIFYSGDPGKSSGPPEDCCPAEDPEIELHKLFVCTHTDCTTKEKVWHDMSALLYHGDFADYVESIVWDLLL